jgi:serine O-acetyltransferase
VVRRNGARICELDQINIPDPVAQEICKLQIRLNKLEEFVSTLTKEEDGD